MDDHRFDRLVRALTTPASRRPALGMILAGAVGWMALADSEAGGKKKRKKKKKGGASSPPPTSPPPPPRPSPPPPPVNRCANRVKDGDESDVDCGGSCKRCEVAKACKSRDDCITANCANFTCDSCQNSGECGSDEYGFCACTSGSCTSNAWKFINGGDCNDCPERSNGCTPYADNTVDGVICFAPCGEGFTEDE